MNAEFLEFTPRQLLGESATHPLARLLTRLPFSRLLAGAPRSVGRGAPRSGDRPAQGRQRPRPRASAPRCAVASAASLLRGSHAIRRTIGCVQLRFL